VQYFGAKGEGRERRREKMGKNKCSQAALFVGGGGEEGKAWGMQLLGSLLTRSLRRGGGGREKGRKR